VLNWPDSLLQVEGKCGCCTELIFFCGVYCFEVVGFAKTCGKKKDYDLRHSGNFTHHLL